MNRFHDFIDSLTPEKLDKWLDADSQVVLDDFFTLRIVHFAKLASFIQTMDIFCDKVLSLYKLLTAKDPAVIFTRISHADLKVRIYPQVTTLNFGLNVSNR